MINVNKSLAKSVIIFFLSVLLSVLTKPLIYAAGMEHFDLYNYSDKFFELELKILKNINKVNNFRDSNYYVHRVIQFRGLVYRYYYDREFRPDIYSKYEDTSMSLLLESRATPRAIIAKESAWMASLSLCNGNESEAKKYILLANKYGLSLKRDKVKPLEKCIK